MRKDIMLSVVVLLICRTDVYSRLAVDTLDPNMNIKIVAPKMDELIAKLWYDLPKDCTPKFPPNVTVEGGEENAMCASIALSHLRKQIVTCKAEDAFLKALKTEFKLVKLLPLGKAAGVALDVADLTAKAMSANSPEDFEADLVKYGFGKLVGDELVGKLKKLVDVPPGEEGDALGNLAKLFYKELWDKAKNSIFPKEEEFACHPSTKFCENNIFIKVIKAEDENSKAICKLVFSADGNCHCKLGCGSMPGLYLEQWNVHGEMNLMLEKTEIVTEGLLKKTKVLQVTLKAEKPKYSVTANCNCTHPDSVSYTVPKPVDISYSMPNEVAIVIGEMHFGDKYFHFNSIGGNVAYSRFVTNSLAVTLNGDYYVHKENQSGYQQQYNLFSLMAGVSFVPSLFESSAKKLVITVHAFAGISSLSQKLTYNGLENKTTNSTAFALNIGATNDILLTPHFKIRVPQIDYTPTFFWKKMQHNYRAGVGAAYRW